MIETRLATLERTSERVLEIRFKPDVKLDVEGLSEVVKAKHALCRTECDVLAVLPAEVDFELNVLAVDHSEANGGCALAKRLAFAANSPFNERIAKIYFRYHPRANETEVFVEEADARRWLAHSMPQPSLS
jgi:hypothetical protein